MERPDGDLVSYSDQNGLLRRNDTFVQMVIPVTGVYVLHVEDFLFGGGLENFNYQLLVSLDSP